MTSVNAKQEALLDELLKDYTSPHDILGAPGHMKVVTFGKPYLPTLHMAFKAKRTRAEVPKSIKDSCCGTMAIRRL